MESHAFEVASLENLQTSFAYFFAASRERSHDPKTLSGLKVSP